MIKQKKQNQTLKQYLKIYVNYQQDNWAWLLFVIEYVYNNNWHSVIKMSSFAILYRDDDISKWKNQIQKDFEKNVLTTRARIEEVTKLRNNYTNDWKKREIIKLNITMKNTFFEFSILKTKFYWTSKIFISLDHQRNLITSIKNRLKSKNLLRSKFINCDYLIRFEYTMCFTFLCWNRTKSDSTT
jgi:hypothetical protein